MLTPALIDLGPAATIAAIGALVAVLFVALDLWRRRGRGPGAGAPDRLHALTLLTLFLTFDLVVFGAYTRLSDSGLGCPDWPGCYASASPAGAQAAIQAAETHQPSGPVTQAKAWVEMVHRYLATAVGALISLIMVTTWWRVARARRQAAPAQRSSAHEPGRVEPASARLAVPGAGARTWATLSFVWVCAQGAFGALTVTMKLYPAIVTLHLLGGIGLLALLAVQVRRGAPAVDTIGLAGSMPAPALGQRRVLALVFVLVLAQIALGGWVSTNYAVLACSDFPTCHTRWWPDADFSAGYTLLRHLGRQGDGSLLAANALTAIHLGHRLGALALLSGVALAAWWLRRAVFSPWQRRAWHAVLLLVAAQVLTGISNIVLGWPMPAALAHTAGAAALLALLAALLTRPAGSIGSAASARPAHPARPAPSRPQSA